MPQHDPKGPIHTFVPNKSSALTAEPITLPELSTAAGIDREPETVEDRKQRFEDLVDLQRGDIKSYNERRAQAEADNPREVWARSFAEEMMRESLSHQIREAQSERPPSPLRDELLRRNYVQTAGTGASSSLEWGWAGRGTPEQEEALIAGSEAIFTLGAFITNIARAQDRLEEGSGNRGFYGELAANMLPPQGVAEGGTTSEAMQVVKNLWAYVAPNATRDVRREMGKQTFNDAMDKMFSRYKAGEVSWEDYLEAGRWLYDQGYAGGSISGGGAFQQAMRMQRGMLPGGTEKEIQAFLRDRRITGVNEDGSLDRLSEREMQQMGHVAGGALGVAMIAAVGAALPISVSAGAISAAWMGTNTVLQIRARRLEGYGLWDSIDKGAGTAIMSGFSYADAVKRYMRGVMDRPSIVGGFLFDTPDWAAWDKKLARIGYNAVSTPMGMLATELAFGVGVEGAALALGRSAGRALGDVVGKGANAAKARFGISQAMHQDPERALTAGQRLASEVIEREGRLPTSTRESLGVPQELGEAENLTETVLRQAADENDPQVGFWGEVREEYDGIVNWTRTVSREPTHFRDDWVRFMNGGTDPATLTSPVVKAHQKLSEMTGKVLRQYTTPEDQQRFLRLVAEVKRGLATQSKRIRMGDASVDDYIRKNFMDYLKRQPALGGDMSTFDLMRRMVATMGHNRPYQPSRIAGVMEAVEDALKESRETGEMAYQKLWDAFGGAHASDPELDDLAGRFMAMLRREGITLDEGRALDLQNALRLAETGLDVKALPAIAQRGYVTTGEAAKAFIESGNSVYLWAGIPLGSVSKKALWSAGLLTAGYVHEQVSEDEGLNVVTSLLVAGAFLKLMGPNFYQAVKHWGTDSIFNNRLMPLGYRDINGRYLFAKPFTDGQKPITDLLSMKNRFTASIRAQLEPGALGMKKPFGIELAKQRKFLGREGNIGRNMQEWGAFLFGDRFRDPRLYRARAQAKKLMAEINYQSFMLTRRTDEALDRIIKRRLDEFASDPDAAKALREEIALTGSAEDVKLADKNLGKWITQEVRALPTYHIYGDPRTIKLPDGTVREIAGDADALKIASQVEQQLKLTPQDLTDIARVVEDTREGFRRIGDEYVRFGLYAQETIDLRSAEGYLPRYYQDAQMRIFGIVPDNADAVKVNKRTGLNEPTGSGKSALELKESGLMEGLPGGGKAGIRYTDGIPFYVMKDEMKMITDIRFLTAQGFSDAAGRLAQEGTFKMLREMDDVVWKPADNWFSGIQKLIRARDILEAKRYNIISGYIDDLNARGVAPEDVLEKATQRWQADYDELTKKIEHMRDPTQEGNFQKWLADNSDEWKPGRVEQRSETADDLLAEKYTRTLRDDQGNVYRKDVYLRLPDNPEMGSLAGRYVEEGIYDWLKSYDSILGRQVRSQMYKGGLPNAAVRSWNWIYNQFKLMMTSRNIPTHVGNIGSNIFIAHTIGGVPFWRQATRIREAVRAAARREGDPVLIKHAIENGVLGGGTFMSSEAKTFLTEAVHEIAAGNMRNLIADINAVEKAAGAGGDMNILKKAGRWTFDKVRGLDEAFQSAYNVEEETFKYMVFAHKYRELTEGVTAKDVADLPAFLKARAEEAADFAKETLVDYSEKSPITNLMSKGSFIPFFTFGAGIAEPMLRSFLQHPERFASIMLPFLAWESITKATIGAAPIQPYNTKRSSVMDLSYMQLPMIASDGSVLFLSTGRFLPWSTWGNQTIENSILPSWWPAALTPASPIQSLISMWYKRDPVTQTPLFTELDTTIDKVLKVGNELGQLAIPPMISRQAWNAFKAGSIRANPEEAVFEFLAMGGLRVVPVEQNLGMLDAAHTRRIRTSQTQSIANMRRRMRRGDNQIDVINERLRDQAKIMEFIYERAAELGTTAERLQLFYEQFEKSRQNKLARTFTYNAATGDRWFERLARDIQTRRQSTEGREIEMPELPEPPEYFTNPENR